MEGLNAASVAVLSAYHYECTMAALARGCHVICEKPIALDIKEVREMIREAEKRGLKLAIGFCKRFMQQVQLTREFVQQSRLGRPVMYRHISAWEIRPKPWIMDKHFGGGPIFDISCHYTDQWRVILGSNPVRVKASGLTIMALSPDKPDIDPRGVAHAHLAWLLEDTKFVERKELVSGVFAYIFAGADRAVAVLSSKPGHADYVVPAARNVQPTDLFGNPVSPRTKLKNNLIYLSAPTLRALKEALKI